jgi:AbrB family transcriptional regulator (stage V sporulation protein T)
MVLTATGVVRRIDDLGRVVIPKELRRKLKWRSGAPVEIFTAQDGQVVLKKYTPMGEDSALAQKICDRVAESSKCAVCVSDMDHIIAAAGCTSKGALMDKDISQELENAINSRKLLKAERFPVVISLDTDHVYKYCAVAPIITGGDTEGAVILMSNDAAIGDAEVMLARTVSAFLSDHLEF